MLQNARVIGYIVPELLRENQQGGGKITPPPHTHTEPDFLVQIFPKSIFPVKIGKSEHHH